MEFRDKVIKAKKGDKQAFVEIIQDIKVYLYRMAFMYAKNEDDALEIVDEVVYKSYLSLNKLKKPEYFKTWVTRILINTSIDYIKKNKKILFFDEKINSNDNKSVCEDTDEIIDLYAAVEKLDGNCKTVIILKYFNDMKIREIADLLNISDSRVKNYLHKGLENLRVRLKEGAVCEK